MRRLALLLLTLTAVAAPAAMLLATPPAEIRFRLRAMQPPTERLIERGLAESATFRRLVHELQQSNVIVYVEIRPDLRTHVGGSLRFLAKSATDRFLRISLNATNSEAMLVALLGHELQHAVEVANAPDIVDEKSFRDFYRANGLRTGRDSFDSLAAQQAGWVVREEMRSSPNHPRLARHDDEAERRLLEGQTIESAQP
jgi:hypothetical protein